MPWTGSGSYVLPPAFSPEVNGTTVDATRYNGLTTDVANGVTAALAKNGENVPTANLPMAGFKHTGMGEGTSVGQALTYNQTAGALLGGTLGVTGLITATGGVAGACTGALNGTIGATTPNTGVFTTLSASGAVTGVGFSNYLATPPAIGGTTPAAGTFTTLSATTGTGIATLNASNLSTGTVPDARFPGTLPAASGANLTALNASNLASGTVPTARVTTVTATGAVMSTQSGSAPSYAARAWARVTSGGGLTAGGNIASVSRTGAGRYTVNFTTAMPSVNYVVVVSQEDNAGNTNSISVHTLGTGSFSVTTVDSGSNVADRPFCAVVFSG